MSTKAYALLIGPTGLGYMGLLQGLIGLSGLVAGMGLGTGLVRLGAEALEQANEAKVSALRGAAWRLFWLLGGAAAALLVVLREPLGRLMLGGAEHAGSVALLSLALLCNMASELQTGILNAHHRVSALAKVGVLNSVLSAALTVALVWVWGHEGILTAVLGVPMLSWGVSRYFLWRGVPAASVASVGELVASGRALLRFGAPYALSMVAGAGVQFLVPVLVLNALGQEAVGYYRAAVTISVTYLGFLLSAMALDYFPRVSAISIQPAQLVSLINQQHRLIMFLGVPMILGMLALAPYLIPLVYSSEFMPTVTIVEWQLIGDIVKFSSWTMSFVVLARSGSLVFLLAEIVGGGSYLAATWFGMHTFGLVGLGMGHLVSYAIYFVVVWAILKKTVNFRWSRENRVMVWGALAAATVVHLLPLTSLDGLRLPLALVVAAAAGLGGVYALWREMGGIRVKAG